MKLLIVAIRDAASESYLQPQFVQTRGLALRSFGDEVNSQREGNLLNTHPEHFSLYEIGKFDPHTGRIDAPAEPEFITKATDVQR